MSQDSEGTTLNCLKLPLDITTGARILCAISSN
uniref:Uncharacterized protein n=1 Tax=Arundo donax TaxID=35708 RepID=A0A0A8Y949_ARUDO